VVDEPDAALLHLHGSHLRAVGSLREAGRRRRGSLVRGSLPRLGGQGARRPALGRVRRRHGRLLEDGALDASVGGRLRRADDDRHGRLAPALCGGRPALRLCRRERCGVRRHHVRAVAREGLVPVDARLVARALRLLGARDRRLRGHRCRVRPVLCKGRHLARARSAARRPPGAARGRADPGARRRSPYRLLRPRDRPVSRLPAMSISRSS
jgi:hypothetical protein